MKNVFKLMKKELDKIFRDPRLIFTTILLPGILLFILYTLFGNISSDLTSDITKHTSVIYVYGDISELDPIWEIADLNVEIVKSDKISENDAEKLISMLNPSASSIINSLFQYTWIPLIQIPHQPIPA